MHSHAPQEADGMPDDEDVPRRLRPEEDQPEDPERPHDHPLRGIVGKLDEVAEHLTRPYLRDIEALRPDEGRGLSPRFPLAPETGRGTTLTLDADGEQEMAVGDEVWVHVPVAGRHGWTYDVEGDERVVEVDERAEIIEAGAHLPPPDGTEFVVRAERRGGVVVRFEPIDDEAGVPPRRLRVQVR
jgi:hypothetical protein